jgi:high-affinity iron transporter
MGKSLFSVPIFFIVFRETLEAAIIVSVLLGLVEQIVQDDPNRVVDVPQTTVGDSKDDSPSSPVASDPEESTIRTRRLVRKLRIQVNTLYNLIRNRLMICRFS